MSTLRPQGLELGGWGLQKMCLALNLASKEELNAETPVSIPAMCMRYFHMQGFPFSTSQGLAQNVWANPCSPDEDTRGRGTKDLAKGSRHVLTGAGMPGPSCSSSPERMRA